MREYLENKLKMNLQLFADAGEGEGEDGSAGDGEGSEGEAGGDKESSELEKLQQQLEDMRKEQKSELDKYRNKVGHLEKQLKDKEKEKMTEEEKLQAEREELEKEKQQLRVDKLEAYRSKKIADTKAKLDYNSQLDKFEDFIKFSHDTEESKIDEAVENLKSLEQSIRNTLLEELKDGGSIINSRGGSKKDKKVSSAVQKVIEKKQKAKENKESYPKEWK